jgi:hypothetical protein
VLGLLNAPRQGQRVRMPGYVGRPQAMGKPGRMCTCCAAERRPRSVPSRSAEVKAATE